MINPPKSTHSFPTSFAISLSYCPFFWLFFPIGTIQTTSCKSARPNNLQNHHHQLASSGDYEGGVSKVSGGYQEVSGGVMSDGPLGAGDAGMGNN